jgi:methionyl-tRNA formyltransferase
VRVVILTSMSRGLGSLALPRLVAAGHEVVGVIVSHERTKRDLKWLKRRAKKIVKIGLLGALNGRRIRRWFMDEPADVLGIEPIEQVARRHGVPLHTTERLNSPATVELMQAARPDIGLSLGCSYIGRKVFSTPARGMVNTHHEVLPEYRGAQTVLWQLYHGSRTTGYTIHQIDASIDGGPILYQERVPIELKPTLHETVVANCANLYRRSIDGLLHVIDHYPELSAAVQPQPPGRSFTTPSFWQFLRIRRNHRALVAGKR